MYLHTWLHPNKPTKGMDATKQSNWPQRPTSDNPQRENVQGNGKEAKSKQTSIEKGKNHEKWQTKHKHTQRR